MSKERLEKIIKQVKRSDEYAEKGLWEASDGMIVHLHNEGHINYLIEQAKNEKSISEKVDELHMFLQKNSEVKEHWGKHVIDVAIKIIEEQSEQLSKKGNDLKDITKDLKDTLERMEEWRERAIDLSDSSLDLMEKYNNYIISLKGK